MFSIRKSSTELNDTLEPQCHLPSALSPEAHAEWGLYKILEHMGLHDKETKSCVFLEYTRSMDTNEDWAEKKEQEKK